MENGPGMKMYFLNIGIFQPAMLVYRCLEGIVFTPARVVGVEKRATKGKIPNGK